MKSNEQILYPFVSRRQTQEKRGYLPRMGVRALRHIPRRLDGTLLCSGSIIGRSIPEKSFLYGILRTIIRDIA